MQYTNTWSHNDGDIYNKISYMYINQLLNKINSATYHWLFMRFDIKLGEATFTLI